MIGIDHREQGRKERALAEYYRTLARYPTECGEPITYQFTKKSDFSIFDFLNFVSEIQNFPF